MVGKEVRRVLTTICVRRLERLERFERMELLERFERPTFAGDRGFRMIDKIVGSDAVD